MTTPLELVGALGGHPSAALGLDLGDDEGLWRWLVAACLLSAVEERALAAWRDLDAAGLLDRATLARADASTLALRLEASGLPRPERAALTLVRGARALDRRGGPLAAQLHGAGDLASAGEALVSLAPGLGPATALRFLRALREHVPGAREAPLAAPALAAARCLGWLSGDVEPEDAFARLVQRLRGAAASDPQGEPPLVDVEAALERLGAASCAKARPRRCPLAASCALRYRQGP